MPFFLNAEFKSFITSVILSNDLVPRVSFQSICRLRNDVLDAICRAKTSKAHIMQAVFRDFEVDDLLYAPGSEPDSELRRSITHYQVPPEMTDLLPLANYSLTAVCEYSSRG